jgi:glyoxylase-like metal-dependent hydrolase (beta-lactamase superfamily II)
MDELPGGLRRVTLPLPTRPGHVHAYLLPGEDGWTLVDTGLGLPDASELWAAELAQAGGSVARIFITHFHPDHVGAAADVAALTGAPVLQGRLDYAQCARVWGNDDWAAELADWFQRHGAPPVVTHELVGEGAFYRPFVRYQADPALVDDGDLVDGWEIVAAPGHADGQLTLFRDGLLGRITPAVGLWPESRPDPLGDFLDALERTIALEPRVAFPGHGDVIDDPVGRALQLLEHHRERLDATAAALGREPSSGYDVSFPLFGADLKPSARRFAVAETLSHLERLVREGRAVRHEGTGRVAYTAL